MKSALKPAIDDVDRALGSLEEALENCLAKLDRPQPKAKDDALPQLDLTRNEREVNRKIAARLDQTIHRLETLLSEEE